MTTYLKSLASLPVLLVTGVWREAATRTGTRRLLAGVQGVIIAAGDMATEGRSGTALWTVDCGHWTWSVVAALVAAVVTNKHSDGEKYSRRLLMTELEDTIVMSIGHVGFYNSSITSTTVTCTTVIRWSMVVGLFKDISNN